jgi:hypothetical protein
MMGTRCLTFVENGVGEKLICIYRQFDGYPSGHGAEVAEFLRNMVIVNGIPSGKTGKIANGAGCLAAQLIAKLKDGVGGIYINPITTTDAWQDYEYYIRACVDRGIEVKVKDSSGNVLFAGNTEQFVAYCGDDS